jgi:hypothetical protein
LRKFFRLLIVIVVGVGSSVGIVGEQAEACCSYVRWYMPGTQIVFQNLVGFDHVITPIESTGNQKNYWATQWTWNDSPDGGYTGVQTAGVREDEGPTPGPVALFSLWGASSAVPGPNSKCRPFDWEGIGILCRIDLPTAMTENGIRVRRSTDGKSWTGSIQQPGQIEEVIGTITMPTIRTARNLQSWVEYFGVNNEQQCEALIGSAAYLSFPTLYFGDGSSTKISNASFTTRPCIKSTMVETIRGTQVFFAQGNWTVETPTTTTTSTTMLPTTTTTVPTPSLIGKRCQRVGAVRKVGNKTFVCKKTFKQLTWRINT